MITSFVPKKRLTHYEKIKKFKPELRRFRTVRTQIGDKIKQSDKVKPSQLREYLRLRRKIERGMGRKG